MFSRKLLGLTAAALCSTVATCGQKGPLELPEREAASVPVHMTALVVRCRDAPDSAAGRESGRVANTDALRA